MASPHAVSLAAGPVPCAYTLLALLLTLSLIFSILATATPKWATQAFYDQETGQRVGPIYRSPFRECSYDSLTANGTTAWTLACHPSPACQYPESPVFCQQLSWTQHLLIASCVLIGVAWLSFCLQAVALLALPSENRKGGEAANAPPDQAQSDSEARRHHRHRRAFRFPYPLCFGLSLGANVVFVSGILCFALAEYIGADQLINWRKPQGNYIFDSSSPAPVNQSWVAGPGIAYGAVVWFTGLIGALVWLATLPLLVLVRMERPW